MTVENFLEKFEREAYARNHNAAGSLLLEILNRIELHQDFFPDREKMTTEVLQRHYTRLAATVGFLLADPALDLSEEGYRAFLLSGKLPVIFAASGFDTSAHLLPIIGKAKSNGEFSVNGISDMRKFFAACSLDTLPEGAFQALISIPPDISLPAILSMLSNHVVLTGNAEKNRERLLTLGPLIERATLPDRSLASLAKVWMNCSYAVQPEKHRIKYYLNLLLRKWMKGKKIQTPDLPPKRITKERPTLLVASENFTSLHAMYRCYAPAIRQLKDDFRLILASDPERVDDVSKALFDDVINIKFNAESPRDLVGSIIKSKPDVIFFPSLGMGDWTLLLANLRIAPLQIMSLGHPATSYSDCIDYMVTEEGYVGDPDCYRETVVMTRNGAFTFEMRPDAITIEPNIRENPPVIRIAVPAKPFKLNAAFLESCKRIHQQCNRAVEFHFFINDTGPTFLAVARRLSLQLPCRTYHSADYNTYVRNINNCDFHLSTFPFGATNGIIDSVRQGLPVVSLDGPEVHSHSDSELSRRLNMPSWLSPTTQNEYEQAALRLIHNDQERVEISKRILSQNPDALLLNEKNSTNDFGNTIWWLYQNHENIKARNAHVITVNDRLQHDEAIGVC